MDTVRTISELGYTIAPAERAPGYVWRYDADGEEAEVSRPYATHRQAILAAIDDAVDSGMLPPDHRLAA